MSAWAQQVKQLRAELKKLDRRILQALDLCDEMCACEEGRMCTACRIKEVLEGREP